jgi:elongation factor G
MGELHLEIYVERMRCEYGVAFRETITKRAEFAYTHKKQTRERRHGRERAEQLQLCGREEVLLGAGEGHRDGERVCMVLRDGAFHAVDSSELAFRSASIGAFLGAYIKTKPVGLEPIMTVEVVATVEFQSAPLFCICVHLFSLC